MINRRMVRPLVSASLALALGAPAAAWGQDVGPYDPLGLRAGAFSIYPTLTVSGAYNDNIYATKNDTEDDLITLIQPSITAESNFTRHRVRLRAGSDIAVYASEHDENYQDFFVAGDGRLDVTRQNFFDGNVEFARGHDSRDDPEDDGDRRQLEKFHEYSSQLSFTQLFNRFNVRVLGSAVRTAYLESDEADRDQWSYTGALRTGFFVSPRINTFVQGTYNIRKRDRRHDFDDIDRDSSGFGADVGAEIDLTNLLIGEFSVGYRQQSYDQDGFDDQSGLGYDIDLTYTPTQLTTLVLNGGGDFRPTSSNGSGAESNFRSTVGLGVTHELLRNVHLFANADYTRDDFNGPSRTDDTLGLGTGATYLINRNFSVNAGYRFTNRWSDLSDKEFTRNVVRIGVTARL